VPAVPAFLSARAMRLLNIAILIWAAFWIAVAVYTAYEVAALKTLSHTIVKAGAATESTGHALAALNAIPFLGAQIGHLAQQAITAGASARTSGASTAHSIHRLAVLLGIAIGLIPTVPLLALYLPLRVSWKRDRKSIRHAVAQWDGEPGLETFLAQRAIAHLPFHELRRLGYDGTPESASHGELAAAELRRLGLGRTTKRRFLLRRARERVPS
jgi:hypothetical protein